MAFTHSAAGIKLDAIERGVPVPDGLHNLRLGYFFAAANNVAVPGIAVDKRLVLCMAVILDLLNFRDCRVVAAFLNELQSVGLQQVFHIFANGGRSGQPGRLDAGNLNEMIGLFGNIDIEIAALQCGSQAGKRGNDFPFADFRNHRNRQPEYFFQVFRMGRQVGFVLGFIGRGTNHHRALHGGDDQRSL